MTPAELGRFVRERLPKIVPLVRLGVATGPKETGLASFEAQELVDALTCAMGLLRQALLVLDYRCADTDLIENLSLVLGEGGEGEA